MVADSSEELALAPVARPAKSPWAVAVMSPALTIYAVPPKIEDVAPVALAA
jgi:hypothetical protein